MRTTQYDSESESIKDVENTTQANAFNWVAMNVGNGIHTIVVADTFAHGVVSKRTLTVDTTNYAITRPPA